MGAAGFAEGRSREQAACACQLDRARARAASSLQLHLRRGPSSAQCPEGLEEMNASPGCSAWLCCAASKRKEGSAALPAPWRWAETRASLATGDNERRSNGCGAGLS